ncbi:hypothetical protein BOC40_11640 [Burkholderia pseudomallei]|uniref:hypothetical protein n=1 Tax=Burkholderia pseudomallei TaxID=28450 RepID=UPI000A19FD6E|nr:hypothetical protein [Burkholderia pseudomallei]ARK80979.1 hypothetical protein BOC40_11640 [Burkholderia pseudomallei]ARL45439.1 hypothetical protein BOC50_20240 [Burkholderia pseudomallei]
MSKTLTDQQIEDVLADAGIDFYSQGNVTGSAKDLFNGVRACVILDTQQPEPPCEALRGSGTNASEPSMSKTLTEISSILASEIECSIFEAHVAPALEIARKVLATQQPEPRDEVTDEQIATMFEQVTGFSLDDGRAALNDADILGFARELLEAARAGDAS